MLTKNSFSKFIKFLPINNSRKISALMLKNKAIVLNDRDYLNCLK